MFWNVASARDEISLRKWSGGTAKLHTLGSQTHVAREGVLCGLQCFLEFSNN